MKRIIHVITILLISIQLAHAQQKQISGIVKGEDGVPIPFVTVKLKNASTGALTDKDGRFMLNVPGNDAVIQIHSINYQPREVTVGNSLNITVVLVPDTKTLGEMVVTAMNIKRKKNELAYSSQQVTADELNRTRSSNIVSALSGKVAGLQVSQNNMMGGSSNIVLRGSKSISFNNQALFVIDGVPVDNTNNNSGTQKLGRGGYDYGNAAADINQDDVESVNVLKGAAAAALYGSRASNGVIMITTKKGRKGLGITVNTGLVFGKADKSTLPVYQKQFGEGYYDPVSNVYDSPDGYFFYKDVNGDGIKDLISPLTEDASYGAPYNPDLMVYDWRSFYKGSPTYGKAFPFVAPKHDPNSFFENSLATNNSILIDGGGDNGYFKLGYTKTTEKGLLPNSKLGKDMVNFGASHRVTDRLTASGNINYTFTSGKGRYGTGYDANNVMRSFRQFYALNVDMMDQKAAYFNTGRNITWNMKSTTDPSPLYENNPYWNRYENYENDERYRYFGNVSLNYKLTDWLDLLGRVSLDSYSEAQEERIAVGSRGVSRYQRFNRNFSEYNYDLLLNLNKKLTEQLVLKGVLGTNIRRTKVSSVFASTNGGLSAPKLYTLDNSVNPIIAPSEFLSETQVDGIFADANLGYKDMLFLDATIRRDRSSTLPQHNNTYYYPSISAGFAFSQLLKSLTWLSFGKLRLNYAEVGSDAPPLNVLTTYDKPTPFGSAVSFSVAGALNNPDLKPERTKSIEGGLELSFFSNRLGFDITYYKTNTINQILAAPVSTASGYNTKVVNAGNVENRGIEVTVNATPVKTHDFSWAINLNWARNRNKILSLPAGIDNVVLGAGNFQSGTSLNASLGGPYGVIRGTDFIIDPETGKRIVDESGYYKTGGNGIIGNPNPDWIGGITNIFTYKNISCSFLVDMRQGGQLFSLDMFYGTGAGLYPNTTGLNELGKSVRDPGPDGGVIYDGIVIDADGKRHPNTKRVPYTGQRGLGSNSSPHAEFIYDASYIKLREIALSYSLPPALISKIGWIKAIDIAVIGRNLWIIHKKLPYADPEDNLGSGNLQGNMGGGYPTARTYGFNLKCRF
ncbi:MAG TPA: SusC/RagA family TonB-linked outer membrane protein [Chitinophaga sp.]|uniref:SusC/RagA family TonB-linked outer membrane protein n=1 Tax=Chitinophaga sp. TaxID=1869181 RepID=UPI002CD13E63|nr:SusC/RagA family TonB-linked outer membrane protein [Chitinophaga sp.]HVI45336.1 SusC/RagA family TonB-linked outer membrane protein [Chitinophaga sp.]